MSEKHINKSPLPQHEGHLGVGMIGYKQTSIGIIPQDWEVVRLGEVGDIVGGGTPDTTNQTFWNGEIAWISSSDIDEESIYKISTRRFINEFAIKNSATNLIPAKSVLIISRVGVGKVAVNEKNLCTSQDTQSLIPKSDNYIFMAYLVKFNIKKLLQYNQGTSIKGFTKTELKSLQIPLPPLKEQEKIARILGVWDSALDTLANLIKAKRKYKTALMQRLLTPPNAKKSTHPLAPSAREGEREGGDFTREGEIEKAPPLAGGVWGGVSVPSDRECEEALATKQSTKESLRFAGFSDKWQEFRLGDLFEITRGYVLPIKEIKRQQSKEYYYPVYSSQTINGGLLGYYKDYLFENCITWTTDGANAGEVNFRAGKFYCTNVCGVLINKNGYANKCVAEIINSVSKKYVSYVGNPKLMNNVMSGIKIEIPTLAEQKKIAQVLSVCDKEIETLNLKFECLKAQKRGLMQQLLSGSVRVKC